MGIAEANMMGVAAGLATCGKIPFVSTFAMFAAGRAFEQIRNSICYPRLNVKVCATHAGINSWRRWCISSICGRFIINEKQYQIWLLFHHADAVETKAAIEAIAEYNGPCYVRLGRSAC